ncbi:phosphate transport system substrate-binding protein [Humitalea rosea]|uniref:Phosphate transport system substrate-binding protein n=1 Tax=Humitalea rosea TaxID=990373 RepID=A0A2W7KGS9_9PROT|nr:substrate-binding domain-containing protein [Humitalea rosea]PZW47023.1 phosphate transport system substrate-binding protein [Humitalea rosea]
MNRVRAMLLATAAVLAGGGAQAQTQTLAQVFGDPVPSQISRPRPREAVFVVAPGTSRLLATTLSRSFTERYSDAVAPRVELLAAGMVAQAFCSGLGPTAPDVAVLTRQMPRAVIDACAANGVTEIVELHLGFSAVVLAVRRGDALAALTPHQVYEAMRAEKPEGEEFAVNRVATWSQIGQGLPDTPVRMIIPDGDASARPRFNSFIMEAGCRDVSALRLIFDASYRVGKCTTLRNDGRVVERRGGEVPGALLQAEPGTIGVITFGQLQDSGGNLVPLRLNGVIPTATSIANLDYEAVNRVYLYVKRQHARSQRGGGVVRGIREFAMEAVSEAVSGPGGQLVLGGLVPLPPVERTAQRRIADRLERMSH